MLLTFHISIQLAVPKLQVSKRPDPFVEVSLQSKDDYNTFIPLYTTECYQPQLQTATSTAQQQEKQDKQQVTFQPFSLPIDEEIIQQAKPFKFELYYFDKSKGYKSRIGYCKVWCDWIVLIYILVDPWAIESCG